VQIDIVANSGRTDDSIRLLDYDQLQHTETPCNTLQNRDYNLFSSSSAGSAFLVGGVTGCEGGNDRVASGVGGGDGMMLTENMDVRKVGDRAEASAAGGAKKSCENNCYVFEGRVFLSEGVLEHILLRLTLSVCVYVYGCACVREHVCRCTCVCGRTLYQCTFVHLSMFVYLFVYLLVCLYVCMYVYIHHTQTRTCKRFFPPSRALTRPVSLLCLMSVSLSLSLSVYFSLYLPLCLLFSLTFSLSLFLSFSLSLFLSFYLSVFLCSSFAAPPPSSSHPLSLPYTHSHLQTNT